MQKLRVNKSDTTIGWIGTGIMGAPMCGHIIASGFSAVVYNKTKERASGLIEAGAAWAASPREVAERADVIFTIVGFPEDVREVYFAERGILRGARAGSIAVDMTTTEPSLAKEIYEAAGAMGVSTIDAPVSGGDVGARAARLSIMVGGDRNTADALMPLFELMGRNIVYQGGAGAGQHAKMCNQIVAAGNMIGLCESLVYARRCGIDPYRMLESTTKGAANSWLLENLSPKIIRGDLAPGFFVEHFIKDMDIALREAERMGITLPGLALVKSLYMKLRDMGHGRLGAQALVLALDDISNNPQNDAANHYRILG
ncbi:MAG: NAD(P)-dependent oxidoreductase [Deltaproteobacteria bacterium]